MKNPYPYFGNKRKIALEIWGRLGRVDNYVEPFFGSGAMLVHSPLDTTRYEVVNDLDGMISNFWRAIQNSPEEVAKHADWPMFENDYHARNIWLTNERASLCSKLEGNPNYYDPVIAGWWVWAIGCSLSSTISMPGPWNISVRDNVPHLVNTEEPGGITRQIPRDVECGVLCRNGETKPHVEHLVSWFKKLQTRFQRVHVYCGDWTRIMGRSFINRDGITGVMLDPPYGVTRSECYAQDSITVAQDVNKWCVENGDNPNLRIALCGYSEEHANLVNLGWTAYSWQAHNGYSNSVKCSENRTKETIWFSPYTAVPTHSFGF